MVRLLAVRAAISTLKRAMGLSNRLRPATWEWLAICCAALFVLSAWGVEQHRQQVEAEQFLHAVRPEVYTTGGAVFYASGRSLSEAWSQNSVTFNMTATGTSSEAYWALFTKSGAPVSFSLSERLDRTSVAFDWGSFENHYVIGHHIGPGISNVRSLSYAAYRTSHSGSTSKPLLAFQALAPSALSGRTWSHADVAIALPFSDPPHPLKFFRQVPTFIYQPASEESISLKKELLTWAPLLGLLLSPLTGLGMMLLALLGHHRKRGEDTLLQLQIIKINLENDNLALTNRNLALTNEKLEIEVRALRQEAEKTRIVSA